MREEFARFRRQLKVDTPYEYSFSADGRIALITGGASGIGEATCRAFTSAGASVIVADDRARAEHWLRSGGRFGTDSRYLRRGRRQAALAGMSRLDILINNAGIGLVGSVEETELADFQQLFRVNVEGMFLMTRYAMPRCSLLAGRS